MTAIVKPKPALEEFLKLPETEPAPKFLEGEIIQKPMPQGELSKTIDRINSGCARIHLMRTHDK